MVKPPLSRCLPLLMTLVGLLAWVPVTQKPVSAANGATFKLSLQPSIAGDSFYPDVSATAYPAGPAAPDTLPAPMYEEPSSVPAWAQPVTPEGAFNIELTPDGRPLLYMVTYPKAGRTGLYGVPFGSNEPVLLASIATDKEVLELHPIADGLRVLYHYSLGGPPGLFSVAITGTERITLTQDAVWSLTLSPDGASVVYSGDGANGRGLYHILVTGGASTWLSGNLVHSGSFQISPDGRYVVFGSMSSVGFETWLELYSVPIEGGAPIHLNGDVKVAHSSKFLITPDSQTVIFGNLYAVPMTGGTPRQLNTADPESLRPDAWVMPELSPDGRWVVFYGGNLAADRQSLYRAPVAGGPAIQLNGPLGDGEGVQMFFITPDSQRVLYKQGLRNDESSLRSYSVPLESGGPPTPFPPWFWMRPSADGRWLVYGVRLAGGGFDLYSIPTAGGAPVWLNRTMPAGSTGYSAEISPDGLTVLYGTTQRAGSFEPLLNGIYYAPITGGKATELSGIAGQHRIFAGGFLSDSQMVLASVDYDGDGAPAAYAYRVALSSLPSEPLTGDATLFLPYLPSSASP